MTIINEEKKISRIKRKLQIMNGQRNDSKKVNLIDKSKK